MRRILKSGLIARLAAAVSRTPAETRALESPEKFRASIAILMAVTAAFGLLYVPSFLRSINHPSGFAPDVRVPTSEWTVTYAPPRTPCSYDESASSGPCLAAPGNPALWTSPFHRSDKQHAERAQGALWKELWFGTRVPVASLRRARELGANHFVIGWFEGTYRLWIDGKYYGGMHGWYQKEPITVELSSPRLGEDRPLEIALQLQHDSHSIIPDVMNAYGGGEGFYSTEHFQKFKGRLTFWLKSRPFALTLTYTMLALAFLSFWAPAKNKKEYLYLSLHTLVAAFEQSKQLDLFWAGVSPAFDAPIRVLTTAYEPIFGLFVGLAFARVRPSVFKYGLPIAILVPALYTLSLRDTNACFTAVPIVRTWFGPVCYLAGSGACFLQAWLVDGQRRRRLLEFGAGMLVLGLYYAFGVQLIWATMSRAWAGTEHFIVLVFLGIIALRDFRTQAKQARSSPVSEYHRRELLPDRLAGALLFVSLKNSRPDALPDPTALNTWRSHFYSVVSRAGGVVVYRHGEEVMAFFEHGNGQSPGATALAVVDELESLSSLIAHELSRDRRQHSLRASVVLGEIRPVWEEVGGVREPGWEEAGTTTSFVEASRLLEMYPWREHGTAVILRDDTAAEIASEDATIQLAARGLVAHDKHGQEYKLSVYRPGGREVAVPDARAA